MLSKGEQVMLNRLSRLQRIFMLTLAIAGLLVAGYLTWSHYNEGSALCARGGGCDIVRASRYSEVSGIPVAAFGLLGYLAILGILLLETRIPTLQDSVNLGLFGITLIGFVYSSYLTYLEIFVILALCPYCVASAIIMTLLFCLSIYRMVVNFQREGEEIA
jgi:uncharacterized membrane protein